MQQLAQSRLDADDLRERVAQLEQDKRGLQEELELAKRGNHSALDELRKVLHAHSMQQFCIVETGPHVESAVLGHVVLLFVGASLT